MTIVPPLKVVIAGASGDNSNLGVTALLQAAVTGFMRRVPGSEITVFDNGRGVRVDHTHIGPTEIEYRRCGARLSRRYHQPESLSNIRLASRLGGLSNPASCALLAAHAMLDASGGDSFTDLYGPKRLRTVVAVKRAALESGTPLVLLPQTVGPFESNSAQRLARDILTRARFAIARDETSYVLVQELLGQAFDPARHRRGVDLAFGLEAHAPSGVERAVLDRWFEVGGTVAGINVSGLVHNDNGWQSRLGVRADYPRVVDEVVRSLLSESNVRVLLVCHVLSPRDKPESDLRASEAVIEGLPSDLRSRVALAPLLGDPCEVKWLISKCDWFCGTRMHATIAALSSGVPTAAIAYSGKTLGVFDTCGQGRHVADARTMAADEIVDRVTASWRSRTSIETELRASLPAVLARAEHQMDEIVAAVRNCRGTRSGRALTI